MLSFNRKIVENYMLVGYINGKYINGIIFPHSISESFLCTIVDTHTHIYTTYTNLCMYIK